MMHLTRIVATTSRLTFAFLLLLAGSACAAHAQLAARPDGSNGTLRVDTAMMPALGVRKQVVVYLPPSYARETTRRYPVVYYLHGLTGAETDWTRHASLHLTADSLIAAGMKEMIVVMPDGDDGWYSDWTQSTPRATCEADAQRREPAQTYCVENARYATYVARDVVAHVDRTYRTMSDRAHRGIAGLSMGGYGAIKLALQFPDVFSAAASHSGLLTAMQKDAQTTGRPAYAGTIDELRARNGTYQKEFEKVWGSEMARWRANDPAVLATRLAATGRSQMPALYIDTGTEDRLTPTSRALHWELDNLRIPVEYNEYPGAHTWIYWRTHAVQSMRWMAAQIAK
jgi:putative tributyrin esterase